MTLTLPPGTLFAVANDADGRVHLTLDLDTAQLMPNETPLDNALVEV